MCCSPRTDQEEVGRPQTLRQVAFGVAIFDIHISNDTSFTLQQTGYLGGQVPGKQTVPRAELWGAIQILNKVDGKTNIQIPIDAKYVTRALHTEVIWCKDPMEICGQSFSS